MYISRATVWASIDTGAAHETTPDLWRTAVWRRPDETTSRGIYRGAVQGQGTCIAVAEDDDLVESRELPQNPVIPLHREGDEFVVFDPAGWYEEEAHSLRDTTSHDSRSSGVDRGPTSSGHGTYCALIGNKNRRPGYEGDCTSLFTSPDLVHWEYQGPFYRSRREWTLEAEDAACPDFFPIGKGRPRGRRHATCS